MSNTVSLDILHGAVQSVTKGCQCCNTSDAGRFLHFSFFLPLASSLLLQVFPVFSHSMSSSCSPHATPPPTHTLVYSHIIFHLPFTYFSLLFFPVRPTSHYFLIWLILLTTPLPSSFPLPILLYLPLPHPIFLCHLTCSPLLYQLCSHYCCFTLSPLFSPPISSSCLPFGPSPFLSSMYSISG